jgi:hypothetical protein
MESRMNLSMFGLVVANFGEAFCHSSMELGMNLSTVWLGSSKLWRGILSFINGVLDECLSRLREPITRLKARSETRVTERVTRLSSHSLEKWIYEK